MPNIPTPFSIFQRLQELADNGTEDLAELCQILCDAANSGLIHILSSTTQSQFQDFIDTGHIICDPLSGHCTINEATINELN